MRLILWSVMNGRLARASMHWPLMLRADLGVAVLQGSALPKYFPQSGQYVEMHDAYPDNYLLTLSIQ